MRSYLCPCGRITLQPNVNICPFCRKDLSAHSDEYAMKHVKKCALSLAPRQYSERKRGRPSYKEVAEANDHFKRHCRNCGRPHCVGCEEGYCDDWEVQKIDRCPFCGMLPVEVEKEGVYAVICDNCNVKMLAYNREELVSRWNRTG